MEEDTPEREESNCEVRKKKTETKNSSYRHRDERSICSAQDKKTPVVQKDFLNSKMIIIKDFCPYCNHTTEQLARNTHYGHSGVCRKCKSEVSGTMQV